MRLPSGGEARCRDVTQVGKAPPSPETTLSGLTESGLSGKIRLLDDLSRLCRTLRPAPQAGCFVSRLDASKDSAQITSRYRPQLLGGAGRSTGYTVLEVLRLWIAAEARCDRPGRAMQRLGFHCAMTELAERLRRRPNKTGKHQGGENRPWLALSTSPKRPGFLAQRMATVGLEH